MNKFVYKDYCPANARVIVDYTANEKVKFSYPIEWSYRKAVWFRAYQTVISFWVSLHIRIMNDFIWKILLPIGLPIVLIYAYFFPFKTTETTTTFNLWWILEQMGIFFLSLFYLFGIPAIIILYLSRNKEKLSNWIPKLGYWSSLLVGKIKEKQFVPIDVSNKMIIIPSFNNMFLNYECKKDFNKYLTKVEIFELPFSYKLIRTIRLPFMKKTKIEKNDYSFRAVFHFTKNPRKGSMLVQFN